jgi:hypothetical protein
MIYQIMSPLYHEFLSVKPTLRDGGRKGDHGPKPMGNNQKGSDGKYQGE